MSSVNTISHLLSYNENMIIKSNEIMIHDDKNWLNSNGITVYFEKLIWLLFKKSSETENEKIKILPDFKSFETGILTFRPKNLMRFFYSIFV